MEQMNREIKFRVYDYDLKKMRCLNSTHDIVVFDEMQNWKEQNEEHKKINGDLRITITKLESQLNYLRSGEYLNQLKFERDMLEEIVEHGKVSKEDKEFIDMTHRNTELIEENERLKTQLSGTTFCYDEEEHKQIKGGVNG